MYFPSAWIPESSFTVGFGSLTKPFNWMLWGKASRIFTGCSEPKLLAFPPSIHNYLPKQERIAAGFNLPRHVKWRACSIGESLTLLFSYCSARVVLLSVFPQHLVPFWALLLHCGSGLRPLISSQIIFWYDMDLCLKRIRLQALLCGWRMYICLAVIMRLVVQGHSGSWSL